MITWMVPNTLQTNATCVATLKKPAGNLDIIPSVNAAKPKIAAVPPIHRRPNTYVFTRHVKLTFMNGASSTPMPQLV